MKLEVACNVLHERESIVSDNYTYTHAKLGTPEAQKMSERRRRVTDDGRRICVSLVREDLVRDHQSRGRALPSGHIQCSDDMDMDTMVHMDL